MCSVSCTSDCHTNPQKQNIFTPMINSCQAVLFIRRFSRFTQTHLSWLCPASLMLTSSVHSTSFSKWVWLNQLLLCRRQIVDEVAGIVDDSSIYRMCLSYKVAMFNRAPLNTSWRLFSVICGGTGGSFQMPFSSFLVHDISGRGHCELHFICLA